MARMYSTSISMVYIMFRRILGNEVRRLLTRRPVYFDVTMKALHVGGFSLKLTCFDIAFFFYVYDSCGYF